MKIDKKNKCIFNDVYIKDLITHQDKRGYFREILRFPEQKHKKHRLQQPNLAFA